MICRYVQQQPQQKLGLQFRLCGLTEQGSELGLSLDEVEHLLGHSVCEPSAHDHLHVLTWK